MSYDSWKLATPPEYEWDEPEPNCEEEPVPDPKIVDLCEQVVNLGCAVLLVGEGILPYDAVRLTCADDVTQFLERMEGIAHVADVATLDAAVVDKFAMVIHMEREGARL